jgi:hypothetical protein
MNMKIFELVPVVDKLLDNLKTSQVTKINKFLNLNYELKFYNPKPTRLNVSVIQIQYYVSGQMTGKLI